MGDLRVKLYKIELIKNGAKFNAKSIENKQKMKTAFWERFKEVADLRDKLHSGYGGGGGGGGGRGGRGRGSRCESYEW